MLPISRPATAYPSTKSSPNKIKTIQKPKNTQNLNESTNKLTVQIADAFHTKHLQQNVEQNQQNMNEIKSQNVHQAIPEQINKKLLLIMLMKFQIAKMGFQQKKYKNIVEQFVNKANLENVQSKNLKQWVLSRRSQVVQIIMNKNSQENNTKVQKKDKKIKIKKVDKKEQQIYKIEKKQKSQKQQAFYQIKNQKYVNFQSNKIDNVLKHKQQQLSQNQPKLYNLPIVIKPQPIKIHSKLQPHSQMSQLSYNPSHQISSQFPQQQYIHTHNSIENVSNINRPSLLSVPQTHNRMSQISKRIQQPLSVCPICLVQTHYYLVRNCGHLFCYDCMKGYLTQNINNGNYIIDCPQFDCNQKINQHQAESVLDKVLLQRFTKFKQKVTLQLNPQNKFCNRPDCGKLLTKNKNNLQCKSCKITFCQTCQQPDHPGKQCGQILLNEISQTYLDLKIKKCPSCSSPIQKIDGCNHMTCKKCKSQFCWICLGKYTPYHYRIYNCCGCPGLQFDQAQQMGFKRFLQVLFFIFLPVLISLALAAIVLVLPLFMIFDFFTKPCKWISSYDSKCQLAIFQFICCCLPDCLIAFFTYFAMLPRSALAAVFISPIQYFGIIVNIICNVV